MAETIGIHWGPTAILAFIFGAVVMITSLGSLAVTLVAVAGQLF